MKGSSLVILRSLLSEADFFVDEKDLQTFVGATSQSRFFFAFWLWIRGRQSVCWRGVVHFAPVGQGWDAPVFHHVPACVHG